MKPRHRFLLFATPLGMAFTVFTPVGSSARLGPATVPTPIKHLVIQFNENMSFDHFFADYCRTSSRPTPCNLVRATGMPFDNTKPIAVNSGTGTEVVRPFVAPDISPQVEHDVRAQLAADLNQWLAIEGCTSAQHHRCFSYLSTRMIPTGAALADRGTISDETHSSHPVPSWDAHANILDGGSMYGFTGFQPKPLHGPPGPGWGCDSHKDAGWRSSPTARQILVPSCFPDTVDHGIPGYGGAYRPTPVQPNVPTLLQDMDRHGITWKIYGATTDSSPQLYIWSMCPTFASCLYTHERKNLVPSSQFFVDVATGMLPQVSFVLPGANATEGDYSQHNGSSTMVGENMTADIYNAVYPSSGYALNTVFERLWDDCGCFYDHVIPFGTVNGNPAGPRVGAQFVGPYVRAGYTDSTPADFASTDAMIEWIMGIPPISRTSPDATAYGYQKVFTFSLRPAPLTPIAKHSVAEAELQYIASHLPNPDDPT